MSNSSRQVRAALAALAGVAVTVGLATAFGLALLFYAHTVGAIRP